MLRKQNTKYSSSKCSISYTPTNIIRYFIFLIAFFYNVTFFLISIEISMDAIPKAR